MRPALFWTIATIMSGLTTAAILIPLFWRRDGEAPDRPNKARIWVAVGLTVLMPLLALGIYSIFGAPALLTKPERVAVQPSSAADPHSNSATPSGSDGGDLAAAVERLKAKLKDNPQDVAGWELLAQSYEFAGNTALATDARMKAAQATAGEPVAPPPTDIASAALAMLDASLAEKAEMHRRKREFPQALAAFAELARKHTMTADLWADYADAHGASRGRLDNTSAGYIAKALALNPKHIKALWLLGSYQTDNNDYRGALATWEQLAALLPRDSSDFKIISANLAEARDKAATAAPTTVAIVVKSGSSASISGSVDLAGKFKNRVPNGSTLYILARAVDSPGAPLAVTRLTVSGWPIRFELDDSQSMLPTRKLSQFEKVIIEARISRNGDAQARAGDLRGVSPTLNPRAAKSIKLQISDEVT